VFESADQVIPSSIPGRLRSLKQRLDRIIRSELILPEAKQRDFKELPEFLRAHLTVHLVKHYPVVAETVFS
jgi:ATP-dependent Lon protease